MNRRSGTLRASTSPSSEYAIATAFGDAGVSLKSVIQTRRNVVDHAEIVAITHLVEHKRIEKALKALRKLPVVDEVRNVIRVENEERG